jgi:hypothetical protein
MLLGGLLATLCEPMIDNVVLFGWPRTVWLPAFSGNGHDYPAYVPLGFMWFDGGLVYVFYRLFTRGVTARWIWTVSAVFIALDMPLNTVGNWFHFNGFYGPQPTSSVIRCTGSAATWRCSWSAGPCSGG